MKNLKSVPFFLKNRVVHRDDLQATMDYVSELEPAEARVQHIVEFHDENGARKVMVVMLVPRGAD